MPRRYRKRNNRRRKNRPYRRKKSTVPRSLSLGPTYPNGIIARHKYTDQFTLNGMYTQSDIPATAIIGSSHKFTNLILIFAPRTRY